MKDDFRRYALERLIHKCQAPMRPCTVFWNYAILKAGEPINRKEVGDTATVSRAVLETVPDDWFNQGLFTLQADGASRFTLDEGAYGAGPDKL